MNRGPRGAARGRPTSAPRLAAEAEAFLSSQVRSSALFWIACPGRSVDADVPVGSLASLAG
eukprot:9955238-Alexandrium_andersonii.AAC.1